MRSTVPVSVFYAHGTTWWLKVLLCGLPLVGCRADTFDMTSTTLFGSSTHSARAAAAVLRAFAARLGVVPRAVGDVSLAASVCAVESWMTIYPTESLTDTSRFGQAAQTSLASALRLAATGALPEVELSAECAEWAEMSELLDRLGLWVLEWFPGDRTAALEVFQQAAICLSSGSEPRLAAAGELMQFWSEQWFASGDA
jgi:hypothetical protein